MTEDAAHKRTFAAGDWYAVVGEHVTALVPADARARVAGLWDLADSGGSFEAVLDGLLVDGLSTLSGFALVGHGDRTRVPVRGDVTASFRTPNGVVDIADEPDALWVERTIDAVTGGRLVVGGAVDGSDLALVTGVARASVVQFGETASAENAPVETAPDVAPVEAPVAAEPTPEPEPEPAVSEPMTFGDPDSDDPTPTGEQPAVSDDAAYAPDDHDGQTSIGAPLDEFVRPSIGIPGRELAPAVVAHPVAKLIFSTGDVVDVDRVISVGRAPEARRFASSDQPHPVTVSSPNHEISSTHLEIRPGAGADHGMAVVTDMGSTNGTVLVQPGLPPEDLQAGIAVSLIPGAILDLGDGVTIQTTNP
ncbi:FHA domain-containing protein [Nocardioides sp. B-3]|uniref:FHA domain-containing protein n=1 Tax=Nocardioides sp. B-3 TaxID=2895565 RepID=UPI0021521BD2|nr:FHA domain-containing protein [Nocardioides sp. B-3]UUZ57812.1 hypothetical protein LP418_15540 [Nocardioides sp. B-3]